jgi:hypothetical protein
MLTTLAAAMSTIVERTTLGGPRMHHESSLRLQNTLEIAVVQMMYGVPSKRGHQAVLPSGLIDLKGTLVA